MYFPAAAIISNPVTIQRCDKVDCDTLTEVRPQNVRQDIFIVIRDGGICPSLGLFDNMSTIRFVLVAGFDSHALHARFDLKSDAVLTQEEWWGCMIRKSAARKYFVDRQISQDQIL